MNNSNGLLPEGEQRIALSELVKIVDRIPPLNERTLHSWIDVGIDDRGGRIVHLEAEKHGRNWFTSLEAYRRFVVACNSQ